MEHFLALSPKNGATVKMTFSKFSWKLRISSSQLNAIGSFKSTTKWSISWSVFPPENKEYSATDVGLTTPRAAFLWSDGETWREISWPVEIFCIS